MITNKVLIKLSLIFSVLFIFSCSQRIYKIAYPTLNDGRYDSEFPYKSCSEELKKITDTVRKVICNVQYKNYIFDAEQNLRIENINKSTMKRAKSVVYFHRTVTGTGTVIFNDGKRAAVLTCAHTFNKPDTILTFYDQDYLTGVRKVQSIAIKQKQENLVMGFPGDGNCEILVQDRISDVLILTKEFTTSTNFDISVLNYPFGKARDLEWGSFVYLVGYPRGYKIVTKGIVSHPDRDKKGSFLIDALFNTGMSGGILLAIRDGVPNFEVVGITTSAAAEYATVLVPEKIAQQYDDTIPYNGPVYVENKKSISYGITRAISSEAIFKLFEKNAQFLKSKGYSFDYLLSENQK